MKVLFVSRKKKSDIGGLSRFTKELTSHFPHPYHLQSPTSLTFPIFQITHIHLCDATLLPLGVLLKFLTRQPLTLTAHGLDLTYPNPLYQLMLKLFLPKADGIILVSHSIKKLLKSFNLDSGKIHIIPNGISAAHLVIPAKAGIHKLFNSRLGGNNGKIVLLTIGNLVKRKGHTWFIENVFTKLSDHFIYFIVGDGPQRGTIKKTVRKHKFKNKVFLLGQITDNQLSYVLKRSDIYICPNQYIEGDFEGFNIAAGEAAAMGIPVVASNVDGIPQVIKDGQNGFLVQLEATQFLRVINQLKDIKMREKLGQKAKLYTKKNYSWQTTARKYAVIFQSLSV